MPSEKLASAENLLKGNLASAWNILEGSSGDYTDLGIARRFGGAAAAYSLRDIGAMNGRVVKVRRIQDDAVEDFSALQVASGSIEKFAIGQDVLDLYNNAAYFPTDSDYFSLGSGITLSGAFTISYDVVFTGSFGTNTSRIFQDDAGNDLLTFTNANTCKFRVGSIVRSMSALSTALQLGRKYSMIFARDGSGNYTLTIDGVQVSTASTDTDDFLIQRIGFRNRGSVSNVNINSGQHIYAGDGAENSNWLDTGSGTTTNATKVGTPVAFTGQGIDAFVDTWYDQSGNLRDAIQQTSTNQPSILQNGSIVKVNSKPAITFDGNDNFLEVDGTGSAVAYSFSPSGDMGMFIVSKQFTGNVLDSRDGAGDGIFLQQASANTTRFRYNGDGSIDITATRDAQHFSTMTLDGTTLSASVDGGTAGTDTVTAGVSTTSNLVLGKAFSGNNSNFVDGEIQEAIFYENNKTSEKSDIETDIDNFYSIT
jgi:hypothetical protein